MVTGLVTVRADRDPVGAPVDGASVARDFDESLDQFGRCVVALGSVLRKAMADDGEDVRTQFGNHVSGQDHEPRVVEHQGEVLLAQSGRPS